jgi:glutamine amidotransferase PdxT
MSGNPKKEDETQAIGIDFNDFGNQNNSSNENVNSSEDDPIIKEISVPHPKIKKILQNRMNSLKQLSNTWIKGDIRQTIRELSLIKDQGVSCDFFNSAFMQNSYNKDYLTL